MFTVSEASHTLSPSALTTSISKLPFARSNPSEVTETVTFSDTSDGAEENSAWTNSDWSLFCSLKVSL